jgi:methane/phenol/toluene hydroxylase
MKISEAYDRVKDLEWEPTYIAAEEKTVEATRFFLKDAKPNDPFKTFVREYFEQELEKDDRHYALLEASSRLNTGEIDARWMEGMKFGLSNLVGVEYAAARAMGRMARTVAPVELRQGYMMQMLDEMRHSNLEMNVIRHHMRSWKDPVGYDIAAKANANSVGSSIFRSMVEDLMTSDPVETSIGLQVFIETAYTNLFFVGLSSAAAAHGDDMMASTMMTIQSDEARHMANGWATLSALMGDERNIPMIQDAMDKWSWRIHCSFGTGNMLFSDYFVTKRTESAKEMTMRWVMEDFYGGFYQKLEKFGLKPPKFLDQMIADLDWTSHSTAVYLFGAWPVFFHRYDGLNDDDFEWFEKKYPGFYEHFGPFWEAYNACKDPRERKLILKELGGLPNFCQVCHRPTIFPRQDLANPRTVIHKDKHYCLCSDGCEHIFRREADRYIGSKSFYDLYEGKELSQVVQALGYVRDDGSTLMAQPELEPAKMWTLDDVRACDYVVQRPPMPPLSSQDQRQHGEPEAEQQAS